jgi:glyoxylase-like metal-dependent hydrolase (beta-lactamase superfamily II)
LLVANGVEMLEISSQVMGEPNIIHPTLVWNHENVILIDTGYQGQAGVSFEQLNRIILTHHDIDHIGGLASILKGHSGPIDVLAHADEAGFINGARVPLKLEQLSFNVNALPAEMKSFYEKLGLAFQNARAEVNTTLADGQILPYCGGISIILTPGHTLGHICLYLLRTKTLIAGDALRVDEGNLFRASPFTNYDTAQSIQSLQKLTDYDIENVICYHGGLYTGNANQRIAQLTVE